MGAMLKFLSALSVALAVAYTPLASPICATSAEIDTRLTSYGLIAEPRIGRSGPIRAVVAPPLVGFVQEWRDTEYAALVRGDPSRACIIGVAKV
jgi:hypothetical protein